MRKFMIVAAAMIAVLACASSAYALQIIAGFVHDAPDGMSANGFQVKVWKPSNPADFKIGVVANNVFAINCGSPGGFQSPCVHGDVVYAQVIPASGYTSRIGVAVVNTTDGSPSVDYVNLSLAKFRRINVTNVTMDTVSRR